MRRIAEAYANEVRERAGRISKINLTDNPGFKMWKDEHIAFSSNDKVCRLRIGYLSSDFVDHPTADLIQSALLKHDKSRFEIFLYSISRNDESEYRRRLKEGVEHFVHFSQRTSDFMCADVISKGDNRAVPFVKTCSARHAHHALTCTALMSVVVCTNKMEYTSW
jgi:predicted O-linked N-acetylglucosamine transferase (SPINDLY family)